MTVRKLTSTLSAEKNVVMNHLRHMMSLIRKSATSKGPSKTVCNLEGNVLTYATTAVYTPFEQEMRAFMERKGFFEEFVEGLAIKITDRLDAHLQEMYPGLRIVEFKIMPEPETSTTYYTFVLSMDMDDLIAKGCIKV